MIRARINLESQRFAAQAAVYARNVPVLTDRVRKNVARPLGPLAESARHISAAEIRESIDQQYRRPGDPSGSLIWHARGHDGPCAAWPRWWNIRGMIQLWRNR